jgi:DNA-binding GntR family transcriptional regulator
MAAITLSQSIAQTLASEIVSGRLPSGSRLDENSIAKRFNVSRSPVRDALRQLAPTRLVENFPRRGFFVAKVDRTKLQGVYEALSEIEALCAGLCALRAEASERRNIEAIHTKAKAAARADDGEAYAAVNDDLHDAIYASAHNTTIRNIAADLRQQLAPFRSNLFFQRERIEDSLREHQVLIKAIMDRDAEAAASAMRRHAARTALNVLSQLSALSDGSARPMQTRRPTAGKRGAKVRARRRKS